MRDWLDEEIAREGLKHNRSELSRQREERFLNSGAPMVSLFGSHRDSDDTHILREEHIIEHQQRNRSGTLSSTLQAPPLPKNTPVKEPTKDKKFPIKTLVMVIIAAYILCDLILNLSSDL